VIFTYDFSCRLYWLECSIATSPFVLCCDMRVRVREYGGGGRGIKGVCYCKFFFIISSAIGLCMPVKLSFSCIFSLVILCI
jgi:hypothetical protein